VEINVISRQKTCPNEAVKSLLYLLILDRQEHCISLTIESTAMSERLIKTHATGGRQPRKEVCEVANKPICCNRHLTAVTGWHGRLPVFRFPSDTAESGFCSGIRRQETCGLHSRADGRSEANHQPAHTSVHTEGTSLI
jgi:hypothetical protein